MSRIGLEAAEALLRAWERLGQARPVGWSSRIEGAVAVMTGVPSPGLNGVWASHVDARMFGAALDRVAAAGVPYCAQFPVGSVPGVEAARLRGMSKDEDIPLMRLDDEPRPPRPVPAMDIRRLTANDAMQHAEIAAEGFGAPLEVFAPLSTAAVAAQPDLAYYIGEVDGRPVTTGLGIRVGSSIGVFNIATPPQHRGRGYGSAMTAHIVRDARAAGATWSWLQSSPIGKPVYEQLGYRTVSLWECWVTP